MVISKILSGLGHFIHPNPVLVSRPASVPPFPTHKRYLLIASYYEMVGFPSGSVLKNLLQCRRHGFNPWVGKVLWRREWQPHFSIPAWEIPWTQEPGGLQFMGLQKSWTRLCGWTTIATRTIMLGALHMLCKLNPSNDTMIQVLLTAFYDENLKTNESKITHLLNDSTEIWTQV